MEGRPSPTAGSTDDGEQVAKSWIEPSSSGQLVPQRHRKTKGKVAAKADTSTGAGAPELGGLHRYFRPKDKNARPAGKKGRP